MVQWINLHWYTGFVNRQQVFLLYEKTGTVAVVLPVLQLADEILLILEIFKIIY